MANTTSNSNKSANRTKRCRIWWPEQQQHPPDPHALLFGWCFHASPDSLDLVVASRVSSGAIASSFARSDDLQETLISINRRLPYRLLDNASFTLIGSCTISNKTTFASENELNGDVKEEYSEFQRRVLLNSGIWVNMLLSESKSEYFSKEGIATIPVVHNLLIGDVLFEDCDCHVIHYEIPTTGKIHYSLQPWGISQHIQSAKTKPTWIKDLEHRSLAIDLELVFLALNCSNYAKLSIEERARIIKPITRSLLITISDAVWYCAALCVASVSAIAYLFIQWVHMFLTRTCGKGIFLLKILFPYSFNNVRMKSCQFLYWPVLLHNGTSSFPNVEFSHQHSIQSHSHLWSIITNITLGTLLSTLLLSNITSISNYIFIISHTSTESILRSGCVWLMGVPAGFKLNTELARVLGIISLNAIQAYSTIWYFIGVSILRYIGILFIISGVSFGLALQLALLMDLIKLVTLHVKCIHWLVSVLYSRQIQALASLWRIFRGRKWNPLRERLDSYEYTVEQHVVGSLIFSPLLLLLPTTSVFYIFFTILNTVITLLCVCIEGLISVLYVTPYYEMLLWIVNKRRFPSGVWFSNVSVLDEVVVSLLRSNHAKLGQLVRPHYKKMFANVYSSFFKSLAYGVLTGQRIPSNLNTSMPPINPWMNLDFNEYWKLCYGSILASRSVQKEEAFC